jgi:anaerobic magnesium-protoporphyrin IX monomethyl ester cyclase
MKTINEMTFISTVDGVHALGPRRLVSYLRQHVDLNIKLLLNVSSRIQIKSVSKGRVNRYFSPEARKNFLEFVSHSDVVALSLFSGSKPMAEIMTRIIKEEYPDKIVVWGGVHPTIAPEECVDCADYVYVGEGEIGFSRFLNELIEGRDGLNVNGIWARRNGELISNNHEPFVMCIDELGFPEYGMSDSYMLWGDDIVELTIGREKKLTGQTLWVLMTQGCPHKCRYCANSALISENKDYARVRRYSVSALTDYVLKMKKKLDFHSVLFYDDAFMDAPLHIIKEFSEGWGKSVNIPFHILGMHPNAYRKEKIEALIKVGLKRLRMGLQSGSPRVRKEIFRRSYSNDKVVEITNDIKKTNLSLCDYDFILNTPWETTDERLEGLTLLSRMKPPFTVNLFNLTYFPGTPLYQRAFADRLIDTQYEPSKHFEPYLAPNDLINLLYFIYMITHLSESTINWFISKKVFAYNIKNPRCIFKFILFMKYFRTLFYRIKDRDYTNLPSVFSLFIK